MSLGIIIMIATPVNTECWICLQHGGGDNKAGNPLVCDLLVPRWFSGFCLSILLQLIRWAEETKWTMDPQAFGGLWEFCPNCNQRYQNDLALDMLNALVLFADTAYSNSGNRPADEMRVISSLQSKIETCGNIITEQMVRSNTHGTLKAAINMARLKCILKYSLRRFCWWLIKQRTT